MSNRIISEYELARSVSKQLGAVYASKAADQGLIHKTALKVITTFVKFVSHNLKPQFDQ